MDKLSNRSGDIVTILKCLICSYILTGLVLLFLSTLLYKFDLDDGKVGIGIIIIYILASFIGGLILGKIKKNKKFAWGAIFGGSYFIILMLISLSINHTIEGSFMNFFTVLVMCTCGGMIGGMVG